MLKKISLSSILLTIAFGMSSVTLALDKSSAPAEAKTYFISPTDGETVSNPIKVIFGLSGIGVAPAGANLPNTGHHHLIIDAPLPDPNLPVPADDNHKNQTYRLNQRKQKVHFRAVLNTAQVNGCSDQDKQ